MKKQLYLVFPLVLFLLAACGAESNDTSDQTSTPVQKAATAVQKTGTKNKLNNFADWATYRGDQEGTAYSSLSQITTENVQLLEEVDLRCKEACRAGHAVEPDYH